MRRRCVFDLNETPLDLAGLDAPFAQVFGAASVRRDWFRQVLQSALVGTITGVYSDFGAVGAAALRMVAERRGVAISDGDRQETLGGMRRLQPHGDVREGLDLLRAAGVRLAALTNSPPSTAQEQLDYAGRSGYFEQILSADTVRRLKPAPEPYQMAAMRLRVGPFHRNGGQHWPSATRPAGRSWCPSRAS